jgi:hypothetical protein
MSRLLPFASAQRNDDQRLRVEHLPIAGRTEDRTMKMHSPSLVSCLASAALLIGSVAFAQQQYDSLGSPTPAPNQSASPNAVNPNVPIPAGKADGALGTTGKAETSGSASTTGSATSTPSNGGVNGPVNAGTSTPTDPGATPSGLTPD